MAIEIIDNFTVNTTKNIDSRLGPYASVAQATGSISTLLRYVGMTITITGSGQPVEYWFNPTTANTDLVVKTASVTGFVTTSSFNAFTSSYNTGSFTGSFTGSLFGTSSWAISSSRANTSSLALTASFITGSNVHGPLGANSVANASFATSAGSTSNITPAITGNTDNNILTATGGGTIKGEGNLTFDGSLLTIVGNVKQGVATAASGDYSHAEGWEGTAAYGGGSHAEGVQSKTGNPYAFRASANKGIFTIESQYGDVSSIFEVGSTLLYDDTPYTNTNGYQQYTIANVTYNFINTIVTITDLTVGSEGVNIGDINYSDQWQSLGGNQIIGGRYSHAEGNNNQALGPSSHTEGDFTLTLGESSHAEGYSTLALGYASHAEGNSTTSAGSYSHSEGLNTGAIGSYSHTEGYNTQALQTGSHAEGQQTVTSGSYSHAEGEFTTARGESSHAEGNGTIAIGQASHAEGKVTTASGSYSHAEGESTTAKGESSHAEGAMTLAQGGSSHAEGGGTVAFGRYSHAEGSATSASGESSHAEGLGTIALGNYQHTQGQYNITSSAQSAFIIGNGTDDNNRSNLVFAHDSIVEITGSLGVTQGITGSLFGTSSYANQALSASFAISSSRSISSSFAISASHALTASYALQAVSASFAISSSRAVSSSFATTASYVSLLNQNVSLSGSLRLDPTQDPDPLGLDLDSTSLFQSSSNTALGYDLYFRQNGNLVKWKWVEGNLETGLLYGGVVTYSGSSVFVSPGSGLIAEHNATTGSEISPIINYVTWNAITQSIANIATRQVTYLYIDQNGDLQQQSSRFTSQQYHDSIPLGAVGHFDYTQVSAFGGAVQTAYDQISQTSNFIDAFGPLKISGYGLTGQTNSLQLSVGTGTSFIHGGFYQNNPEFPSQTTTPSQATASLARINRSGSAIEFDTNAGNFYTVVDPTKYDRDGDGTLANVGSGNWTIQRVFSDPKTGVLYVYYGQERYTSLLNALQYLPTDPFTEGDTFDFTTFIGFLVLKGNTSNIADTADNSIINGGLFRGSGQGSGGGIALSNLDDLTDVSITSPINGQALVYNSGIWQNGTPTSASFASTASFVQNQYNYKNTTSSSPVTGTLSETQLIQVMFPPNTFAPSDFIKFTATFSKTGTNGSIDFRTKITSSATLPSGFPANQVAFLILGATNLTTQINRRFAVKGGNLVGFPRTSNSAADFAGSTLPLTSISFDTTITQYFYISATLANINDSISLDSIQITNI